MPTFNGKIQMPLGQEEIEPSPAAYIQFISHNHAIQALSQVGYIGANRVFNFESSELTLKTNKLLEKEGILLMDITNTIPETTQAAYQALTIAAFSASVSSKKDNNAAFLIMRTEQNTPSFLFGHHWGFSQYYGKALVDKHIKYSTTPAAFVMFRDRQISIPVSACDADVEVVSKMVAFYITLKEEFFRCSICNTPFITKDETGEEHLAEIAVDNDGNMFKKNCIETLANETLAKDFSATEFTC